MKAIDTLKVGHNLLDEIHWHSVKRCEGHISGYLYIATFGLDTLV